MLKVSQPTIVRTVLLIVAIVNNILALAGKSPLPFDDTQIEEIISYAFTAIMSIISWWYNNSFSQPALKADILMKRLKKGGENY